MLPRRFPVHALETWISLPFVVVGVLYMSLTSIRVATLVCRSVVSAPRMPKPSASDASPSEPSPECRLTTGSFLPHTQIFPVSHLKSATVQSRKDLHGMQAQVVLQLEKDAIALPPTFNGRPFANQVNQFITTETITRLDVIQDDRAQGLAIGLPLCGLGWMAQVLVRRHQRQFCER
ncbi:MAG: hypothetical protein AAFW84_19460 [Cyanobacteria bacterium J06635_15]